MNIREERPGDIAAIRRVNATAFDTPAEAGLVDTLRHSGCDYVSLVAEAEGQIIGHILFTPVSLAGDDRELKLMGLAPMAVMPAHQRQGFGSQLVKAGLERCRALGVDAVVVLGHAGYYPRFGFMPAVNYGIRCAYDVPDEAFMVLELVHGCLDGHHGTIRYHDAFNNV